MANGYCRKCITPQEFEIFKEEAKIDYRISEIRQQSKFKGLMIVLGVYLGINLGLYGIQEIAAYDDIQKIERYSIQLKEDKQKLYNYENMIHERLALRDKTDKLANDIKNGVSSNLQLHHKLVYTYNDGIVLYKKDYGKYKILLKQYNKNVSYVNKLAKNAYRRWWLLPIPVPTRSMHI